MGGLSGETVWSEILIMLNVCLQQSVRLLILN